jgi:hypothetical protein
MMIRNVEKKLIKKKFQSYVEIWCTKVCFKAWERSQFFPEKKEILSKKKLLKLLN